jgi:hypothetical protein
MIFDINKVALAKPERADVSQLIYPPAFWRSFGR